MIRLDDAIRLLGLTDDGIQPRNPDAKAAFASFLRDNQTPSERLMARVLFHLGIQVEPQAVVRGFVVDFLDADNKVIFEVDGSVHDSPEAKAADAKRERILTSAGYRVYRISNDGVRNLMANLAGSV